MHTCAVRDGNRFKIESLNILVLKLINLKLVYER